MTDRIHNENRHMVSLTIMDMNKLRKLLRGEHQPILYEKERIIQTVESRIQGTEQRVKKNYSQGIGMIFN